MLFLTVLTTAMIAGDSHSIASQKNCTPKALSQIFFQKKDLELTSISSNGFIQRDFNPTTDNNFVQTMLMLNGKGEMDMGLFKDSKAILALSDGEIEGVNPFRLGTSLAKKYPEKIIVSADYSTSQNILHKKFAEIFLDNTKPFPFKNDEFDTILLRHGMCKCNGSHCCAGFLSESRESKIFFSEVSRVLNKKNPKSMAILEGNYNVMDEDLDIWIQYLDEIKKEMPIKYDVVKNPIGIFYAIVIRPDLH